MVVYVHSTTVAWQVSFLSVNLQQKMFSLFGQFASFFKSRGTEFQKEEQNIRMSVSRYWNAAFILVLRDICESTHKRFPTLEFMVPSVLVTLLLELSRNWNSFRRATNWKLLKECPTTILNWEALVSTGFQSVGLWKCSKRLSNVAI